MKEFLDLTKPVSLYIHIPFCTTKCGYCAFYSLENSKCAKDDKERFLSVKPGLTGYWATHGRSDISYEERMELELYYVGHASLWMDIRIFFLTFVAVFTHEGAC